MTKLTVRQVREIRRIGTKYSTRKLAKKYGVSNAAIHKIIHRKLRGKLTDSGCPVCGK